MSVHGDILSVYNELVNNKLMFILFIYVFMMKFEYI